MLHYKVWWFYMEDNAVYKLLNKLKDKFSKNNTTVQETNEYAFSNEEIASITEQNKQKIQELKQDIFPKKEKKPSPLSTLNKLTDNQKIDIKPIPTNDETGEVQSQEEMEPKPVLPQKIIEKTDLTTNMTTPSVETDHFEIKELDKELAPVGETESTSQENKPKNSFVNLSPENQKLVMDKWKKIDSSQIDKDIINGKDLLNHNYTITYADEAARFIHYIRKEYETVVCYLIGFNNEKKGIYDQTIFSSKIDEEWRHLNQYIKILEKIRNFKR